MNESGQFDLVIESRSPDQCLFQNLSLAGQIDAQAKNSPLSPTDYLNNYVDPPKIVPSIPVSQASLTINGKAINRRFSQRL